MKTSYRLTVAACLIALLLCPTARGANNFTGDADCVALWPMDAFTTAFSETDPGADITVAANTITWANLSTRDTDSYVYKDYGAGYFSADFSHKFTLNITANSGTVMAAHCWMVANAIDDAKGIDDAGGDYQGILWYYDGASRYIYLQLCQNGVLTSDSVSGVSLSTNYFITITRDDDGGTNATGLLTAEIHTGDYHPGGVHIDTLTVNCGVGEQNDFQYLYVTNTTNSGSANQLVSGTVSQLEVDGAGVPFTAAMADTIGHNHLTNTGTVISATAQEGTGSADFEDDDNDKMSILDADLDAGFPIKNGATVGKYSICMWFRIETLAATMPLFAKRNIGVNESGYAYGSNTGDHTVNVTIGADTTSAKMTATLNTARWYHFGFTYDDSDQSFRLRIWDDTAGAQLAADVTGTMTDTMSLNTNLFYIGHNSGGPGVQFDGLIDEVVVFDDILTAAEIDQIRNGTYPTDPAVNGWWWRRHQ